MTIKFIKILFNFEINVEPKHNDYKITCFHINLFSSIDFEKNIILYLINIIIPINLMYFKLNHYQLYFQIISFYYHPLNYLFIHLIVYPPY